MLYICNKAITRHLYAKAVLHSKISEQEEYKQVSNFFWVYTYRITKMHEAKKE